MPKNPDEYLVMLRFSVTFNDFCDGSRNDVDHDKYFSDLRRLSTNDVFFNKASIPHPNLFRMMYKALKHHGFDRPPHPAPNSRYSRKVAWIIYPGVEFETEHDSAIALITKQNSKKCCALLSVATSTQQVGTSSIGITPLEPLSYNSSFIPPPALPTTAVQAQASGTPTTSTFLVSSQDRFQNNPAIRQLMHAYYQLQLTNSIIAGALPVPPVVPTPPAPTISLSGPAPQFCIPTMLQSHSVPPIVLSSIPVYVSPQLSTHHPPVPLQFVHPHSHAHHHHASAPANSNEIRGQRDSNGSRNAMNMAKRSQNKDSKYTGADNENIMDFIVQYDLVSRGFHLAHHEKRQYVHNLFRGEALRYYYAEFEPLGNNYADVIAKCVTV